MDYSSIWDGAHLEEAFNRLHAHVAWMFTMIGFDDVIVQKVLIITLAGAVLWLLVRRVSGVGYRVNVPVGVLVQTVTVGPVLTFLLVAIPAWLTFRHVEIAKALLSFFRH